MSARRAVHLPRAANRASTTSQARPPGRRLVNRVAPFAVIGLGATMIMAATSASAAPGSVPLGTAESFAILAGSGITNTGSTTVTGDIGTHPTPTQTGFGSIIQTGFNHQDDAVTQGAKDDLVVAYNDASGRTPATSLAVELGGVTLLGGVYTSPTFGLTGTVTLDAQGSDDAVFIFQAGTTLITEVNSRVLLINGANPCNVVWRVGSSATFKTGTRMVGDVLAMTSITAQTRATFEGRLLARNGAVTLDTNTITNGSCAPREPDDTTTTSVDAGSTSTTLGSTSTTLGSTSTTLGSTSTTLGSTSTTLGTTSTSTPTASTIDNRPGTGVTTTTTTVAATTGPNPNPGPGAPDTAIDTSNGSRVGRQPGATPVKTASGQPGVPLRSTPNTPSTRTSLPATGLPSAQLTGLGALLLVIGATSLVAGRRERQAQAR